MAFSVRHPLWISTVKTSKPGAKAFASLFFLECMARASLVTIISLQAYEILQDEQKVSFLFTAVAVVTFSLSFTIPYFIRLTARRYIYTLGTILIMLSAAMLTTGELFGQTAAMLFRTFGTCCLNVTLSLYIMDHIRKQDLVKSEPIRLVYSTFAWVGAPFLGIFLWREFGIWATSLACIASIALTLAMFWYLRLNDKIKAATTPPAINPFKNFYRFWSQPRLRLAWLVAFSRATWWITFYIYAPIYLITAGQSEYMVATVIMLGNLSLLVNLFTAKIAAKISVRLLFGIAFISSGILTFALGFLHEAPFIAAGFFIAAAACTCFIDGVSAIPFMRSVHPYERESMTTVYRSFMDAGELLSPLVYGLTLFILPFSYLFSVLGGWLILTAIVALVFLPKRI